MSGEQGQRKAVCSPRGGGLSALDRLPLPVWVGALVGGFLLLLWARPELPVRPSAPWMVYFLQVFLFVGSTSEHLSDESRGMRRQTFAWGLALLSVCLAIEVASIIDHRFFSLPPATPEFATGAYLLLAADTLYFAFVLPWAAGRGAGILLDWVLPLEKGASEDETEEDA